MAARGARSRKTVEKVITKEETKRQADRFNSIASPTIDRSTVTSPVAGWRRKNSGSIPTTSGASVHSGETVSSGKLSSTGAKLATRIASVVPKEEDKFVAKGKQTAAPRGRGGGVPIKSIEKDRARMKSVKSGRSIHSSQGMRPVSRSTVRTNESPTTPATPPPKSWERTRIWAGGSTPPKPYRGFEHDDDMWMSDGNCLVFFAEETNEDDPRPSCRIHTQVLEQARSVFMINLLRYGEIVMDEDESDFGQSHKSSGGPSTPLHGTWPLGEGVSNLDQMLSDESTLGSVLSQRGSTGRSSGRDTWGSGQTFGDQNVRIPPSIAEGRPAGKAPSDTSTPRPAEITHEIWIRAGLNMPPEIQRRHHMATRNYLALLYGLPLIGNDYLEMLCDLHKVMDTYYELNDPSEQWNSASVIAHYISSKQLDDVRNNLPAALGLMGWSEQQNVRWEGGYIEGFVHTVGMMSPKTPQMKEFKVLSSVTKHKLNNACNALQLRLIEAEERLANFDFPELWYAEGVIPGQAPQKAFDEFRSFLNTFYSTVWGSWPPKDTDHQGHWLSRSVVNRLQNDLGALYDYIVDRDIKWDSSEERHTRKWEMISEAPFRGGSFTPDMPGLPLTTMLVGFDSSMRFEHIPHPYPLLPQSNSTTKEKSAKKGFFSKLSSKSTKETPAVAGPKEQYQMALAFNAATNVDRLGPSFKDNKLLDTFQHHEKSFSPSHLSPPHARLGRWILLYALLQTLSTLSVDSPALKYPHKIRYFASPSLDGLPPWRSTYPGSEPPPQRDAPQTLSYCWRAPQRWARGESPAQGGAPTPPAYEMQAPPPLMLNGVIPNMSELDGRALELARQRSVHKSPLPASVALPSPPPPFPSSPALNAYSAKHALLLAGTGTSPPPMHSHIQPGVNVFGGNPGSPNQAYANMPVGMPLGGMSVAGSSSPGSVQSTPVMMSPRLTSPPQMMADLHVPGHTPGHTPVPIHGQGYARPDVPARSPAREATDPLAGSMRGLRLGGRGGI